MSFPTRPPPGWEPRPWSLPVATSARAACGTDVIAVRMPSLPIVQVRWVFRGGRAMEEPGLGGPARVLAHTARHGTERWDSAGLARALDQIGAVLRVSVSDDISAVTVRALAEHLDQALDVADEVALRATYPDAEVARERAKAIEVQRHALAQPSHLAALWVARAIYGDHAYGRPSVTMAGLQTATPERLRDLHVRLRDVSKAMLMVTGDIDPDHVIAKLLQRHSELPAAPMTPPTACSSLARRQPPRRIVVDRPDSRQCSIALGHTILPRVHPDYLPMVVANQVLGGSPSSRLFMELRERRSLTYGVHSALDVGRCGGDLGVALSCEPSKTEEAVQTVLSALQDLRERPVGALELESARRFLTGSFPARASGIAGISSLLTASWTHHLPDDTWEGHRDRIRAVDPDTLRSVWRRWVDPQAASIVVVGPAQAALDALSGLGPVERHDLDDRGFQG